MSIGIKITKEFIEKKIEEVSYSVIPKTTTTICAIVMRNGFVVTGTSACIDPSEFDLTVGQELAYEKAFEKAWEHEAYILKERIYQFGKYREA